MRDLPLTARAVILVVGLGGGAVWLALLPHVLPLAPWLVFSGLLFLVAAIATEPLAVPLARGGAVSVSTIVHLAGVVVLPLPEVVVLSGVAALVYQIGAGLPWYRTLFNTGSLILTVAFTGLAAALLGAPLALADTRPVLSLISLLLATLAYFVATTTLLALLISALDGTPIAVVLRGYKDSAQLELATGAIGGVVGFVWQHEPWWALAMVFPGSLAYLSLRYMHRVVTEQRRAEEILRQSEARFRALVQNASDVIWIVDRDGLIRYASPSTRAVLGYAPGALAETEARRLLHPDDLAAFSRSLERATAEPGEAILAAWRVRHADGAWRFLEAVATGLLDEPGIRGVVINARDSTERRQAEESLERQALHDALTDLPNRTLLRDRLQQAILGAQRSHDPVALLLLDLDHFKEVNDTLGHAAGDELLRQVGERLQRSLRASDTIARLGGDEFAVVLPATDATRAPVAAERLAAVLDRPFSLEAQSLSVRASVGIALYPEHGEDAEALLRQADVAMYVAKRGGGGYMLYAPEQDLHSKERLALAGELRTALERDEFVLHYQPKVDLRSGRLVGVEALVRWEHPQRGMVPPDQFIPLTEQTGLIGALTERVLRTALEQCRAWLAAGWELSVAVNISMRNLHDPRLPEMFARLLAPAGLPPGLLQVEITESAMMADPVRAVETLDQLRALGVRASVDDFGTGYSSLAYLKRLAVNELKIDRSFVKEMATDENDRTIVRSTIELGHNLGLSVVAEGVEDAATLDLLAAAGCDAAQGYYLSRPLPAAALLAWAQARAPRPGAAEAGRRPG